MGAVVSKIIFKRGSDKFTISNYDSLNEISVTTISGETKTIGELVNGAKIYLIVNTASKWGFTATNFKQLVQIYQEYHDEGLEILAFPSAQFGG